MQIVIYVYDGMTALDAVGPYDILNRLPGTSVLFAGNPAGLKQSCGGLGLVVRRGFNEVGQVRLIGEQVARSTTPTRPINLPTHH